MENTENKIERDTLVGTFVNNKSFGFVVPNDRKIREDIFISKKDFNGARNNQKVVVKITKQPTEDKKAEGEIVKVLGNINKFGVDLMCMVEEYNLPFDFPTYVLEEANKIPDKVNKKDYKNRVDLRDKRIFTIDGEDAKDLDDAVCVEKNDDGNYILSVHIADVSHYVKENSKLDQEAILRGTSVYMLNTVIPMLPERLSNGICSLNAKEDRLTLSVTMEIDKKGNVISSDVYKAVIKVTERMSYTDIARLLRYGKYEKIEPSKYLLKKYNKYIDDFKLMEELAKILANKRENIGALDLDIPETKVVFDKNGKVKGIDKYEYTFANKIIEEFMLTANETIAEKFYWLEAPFIYRVHEKPDNEKISELNKYLFNVGYKIKGNKDDIHTKSFSEVLNKSKGTEEEHVISNLILRTLKIARYENVNKGHFGLASKYYCHFTSPIRRYPDLYIHRIISKYIEDNYNVSEKYKEKQIELSEKYAMTSSEHEKNAQKAEREIIEIKKAEYMENKIGDTYDGIISGVTSFGLFVELPNTIEGLIRFDDIGSDYYTYDESKKVLIGENSKEIFSLGKQVTVKVVEANKNKERIRFKLVTKKKNNKKNNNKKNDKSNKQQEKFIKLKKKNTRKINKTRNK